MGSQIKELGPKDGQDSTVEKWGKGNRRKQEQIPAGRDTVSRTILESKAHN